MCSSEVQPIFPRDSPAQPIEYPRDQLRSWCFACQPRFEHGPWPAVGSGYSIWTSRPECRMVRDPKLAWRRLRKFSTILPPQPLRPEAKEFRLDPHLRGTR